MRNPDLQVELLLSVLFISQGMSRRYRNLVIRTYRASGGHDLGVQKWLRGVYTGKINLRDCNGIGEITSDEMQGVAEKCYRLMYPSPFGP